jgi:hypothetical protein
MRSGLLILAALMLNGCGIGGRDMGLATYDALAQAQADCAAKGGVLKQKDQANAKRLDSFACERK